MSMEVVEERVNSLLGRKEAKLVVHHQGAGTPDRLTVRKIASDHYKAGLDRVFVRSISTGTGGSSALCVVEVYDDAKMADVVPDYVKNRNLPKDQRVSKQKKETEPKPVAPAPKAEKKAEKPTEAKPAEKKEEAKPSPAKETKAAGKEEKPAAKEAKPTPSKETKPAAKPKE